MTVDTVYKSGKSEHDENFPVASRIIASRYRAPILAFYRFARAADDAADHAGLEPPEKLAILAALEDTLLGRSDASADALPLRAELQRRGLSPQHALDLLKAFRQDVTKNRYASWAELIDYCRYSAMPVGRFVLDVHGEAKSTWVFSDALPLRAELQRRGLSPQHALDLLKAFRQDVTKNRYAGWAELIDYCRYSAMPVGRFVLDVHGEPKSTWAASDALCAVLQIINHVQDCGKDYRNIDRVYMPLEDIARHGADVSDLGRLRSSPQLLACLHDVVARTRELLPEASQLPPRVADLRLGIETSVIVALARELLDLLSTRDPLADAVHFSKGRAALIAGRAAASTIVARITGKRATYQAVRDDAA